MTTNLPLLAPEPRLMRGTGPDLGALARRFPWEQRTILHVLEQQCRQRPDADWLVFDGSDRLTFAAARAESHQVAAALKSGGHAPARVALLLRNRRELVTVLLGALASGGVAAPMNPELRGPLLGLLLARCDPAVLVVTDDGLARLRDLPSLAGVQLVVVCDGLAPPTEMVHGVPVVGYAAWTRGASTAPPASLPRPSDLAVLMFTSGTSGGSKAAMWPHHYLYLASAAISDALGHTPDDVLSTPLQMCHIAGLQVFANAALHVGCTAHMKTTFSARTWWEDVAADGATFAMLMGQMASPPTPSVPRRPGWTSGSSMSTTGLSPPASSGSWSTGR